MDQLTPDHIVSTEGRSSRASRKAARVLGVFLVPAALAGALLLGLRAGQGGWPLPAWVPSSLSARLEPRRAATGASGPALYYRDPDGKPAYSRDPAKAADGRDYVPVGMGGDLSFEARPSQAVPAADAAGAGEKKVLYYRNPMGLPDTSPTPKKDSMGMDYIPVFDGEADEAGIVKVSPGKVQRTGVRSELVERRVVVRPVRVPGTLQPDERRVTVISTRSDAFVDKVENVTVGDMVRKYEPLVQVYSPEINAAAAQLIANPGFDGSRRRLQNLNVPAGVIAEMERTRTVPMAITWSSPRDGIVLERGAVEGMKAPAGMVLFRIADLSVMWLLADVPEYELGSIKVGQPVTVRVRSLPSRTFTGRVGVIYPQLNKETRTARVRIELPNPEGVLLADMYADVEIATGAGKPVVAVPDDAVIDTGTRKVVLVDKGEGRFEPREVKVGARGNGFVEIRDGVAEGDRVVTSANFLIDAESNLKAALQGMAAAPTDAPAQSAEVSR